LDDLERKAGLHLYIGQLSEGKDGLGVYRQGIEYLQQALARREQAVSSDEMHEEEEGPALALEETRKQLAQAYCTVAELYLTDLCFEDNAERECESYISQALKLTDPKSDEPIVDALQTVTSLRLSQKRGMEAVDYILRAHEKMKAGCEALASLVGLREVPNPDQACELLELDSVQSLPPFEFRCQTAKLLLECNGILKEEMAGEDPRANMCIGAAVDVLGSLLAENDEVIEIWFLTGEAYAAMNPPNHELASHYWQRSKEMLTSTLQSLEQGVAEADDEDEEEELQLQLDEVTCQLEDVDTKLDEISAVPNDD
jgi:tetratricopeptide (TPR) repeat protein